MSGADPEALKERARQWAAIAQTDRDAAELCVAAYPSIAAYLCQQAAEKLLKAFLVLAEIDFRKTHDLKELGQAAAARYPELGAVVPKMERWTVWNFAYRYPAEKVAEQEPDLDRLREALALIDDLAARLRAATHATGG